MQEFSDFGLHDMRISILITDTRVALKGQDRSFRYPRVLPAGAFYTVMDMDKGKETPI
jgi:hypothetical protein